MTMKLTAEGCCFADVPSSGRGDLAAALRRHEGDPHDSARAAPVPVGSGA